MENVTELSRLIELLELQNHYLEGLLVVSCLSLGSLLFVHFGRFMRWQNA